MSVNWDTLAITIGVLFAGAQIAFASLWASRALRAQLEWSRRESALSFSMTRNEAAHQARMKLDKIFDGRFYASSPPSREDITRLIKEEDGFYTNMTTILSNWNVLAVSIRAGVADEDVAFEMIGISFLDSVAFFRNFLELRHSEQPLSYEYVVELDRRWRQRLETRTGCVNFNEPFVSIEQSGGQDTQPVRFPFWRPGGSSAPSRTQPT